jgi:hypothetical protein
MDSKEPMNSAPSVLSKVRERDLTWITNDPTELDIAVGQSISMDHAFEGIVPNRKDAATPEGPCVKILGVPGTTFDCW